MLNYFTLPTSGTPTGLKANFGKDSNNFEMGKPKWLTSLKSKVLHHGKVNKKTEEGAKTFLEQTQASSPTTAKPSTSVCRKKLTSKDRTQALALLHSQGFNDLERKNGVETTDMRNAFVWALTNGNEIVAQFLIERGIDTTVASQVPPLIIAARHGHKNIVNLLLDHGANIHAENHFGRTALIEACLKGHNAMVKILLERGANVLESDSSGRTPLHKVAEKALTSLVVLLLENGANVHCQDTQGLTPLSDACGTGDAAAARVLIDNGANMMEGDKMGRTPLHKAAQNGREEAVALLLEKGAEVDDKDYFGKTALHRAAEQVMKTTGKVQERHEGVVWLLIKGGADLLSEDDVGNTPLQLLKGGKRKRPFSNKFETFLKTGQQEGDEEAGASERVTVFKKKEAKGIQLEPTIFKKERTRHHLESSKATSSQEFGKLPTARTLHPRWNHVTDVPPMILPPGGGYHPGRSKYERETGFIDPQILRWD